MFAYCGSNPSSRIDNGGYFWDTVFDVVSLVASVAEVVSNPTDVGAWIGLACDVVDVAIPCVGGLGEVADAINTARKAANATDTLHDTGKASSLFVVIGENTNRVSQYANKIGADYLEMADGLSYDEMMVFNRAWITNAMDEGKVIIDIGPDFSRRTSTAYISEFYEMERMSTKEYSLYTRMFERKGNTSTIIEWW